MVGSLSRCPLCARPFAVGGGEPDLPRLSPQLRRVALLIGRGLAMNEVAAELGISPNTVKRHAYLLQRRLGVARRDGIVAIVNYARGYADGLGAREV